MVDIKSVTDEKLDGGVIIILIMYQYRIASLNVSKIRCCAVGLRRGGCIRFKIQMMVFNGLNYFEVLNLIVT